MADIALLVAVRMSACMVVEREEGFGVRMCVYGSRTGRRIRINIQSVTLGRYMLTPSSMMQSAIELVIAARNTQTLHTMALKEREEQVCVCVCVSA